MRAFGGGVLLVMVAACATHDVPTPIPPSRAQSDAPIPDAMVIDAPIDAAIDAPIDAPVAAIQPEVWLRGSTHVHAKPSGDSTTPIPDVIAWYEAHHYDFIVLTDHNQVSEVAKEAPSTKGDVAIRNPPAPGLIVLAGSELTHNPANCTPVGNKWKRCRIHVNAIGVTERPVGKIDWAARKATDRIVKYAAALDQVVRLNGLAQINHPNWFWGMTADMLVELAKRGARFVEIANAQFPKWNKGDAKHPAIETLWDQALVKGAQIWGVASDDAHDYGKRGKYIAGGGYVVVRARRDPKAILEALANGHFYSSSGVELDKAGVIGTDLVVEVAAGATGKYTIDMIENGKIVQTIKGRSATRALPASGYLRADVTRDDGKKAWLQPVRR